MKKKVLCDVAMQALDSDSLTCGSSWWFTGIRVACDLWTSVTSSIIGRIMPISLRLLWLLGKCIQSTGNTAFPIFHDTENTWDLDWVCITWSFVPKESWSDCIFKSFSFILLMICILIGSLYFPSTVFTQLIFVQLALMKIILWCVLIGITRI